jgi:23S rRNA (uracil1939-C5)-methyltransferase
LEAGSETRPRGAVTALHSIEVGSDGVDNKAAAAFHVKSDKGFDWHAALKDLACLKGFEVWISDPAKRGRGRRILKEGDTKLFERTLALTLGSGVSVFSQANRVQNQQLVQRVIELAGGGDERDLSESVVLDLYSGSGNLTLPLAEQGANITGVESNPEAVRDARENARLTGLAETRFIRERAGIKKTLDKLKPDVVLLDPPRGGGLGTIKALADARPKRVVYVSCSPPTLARDASYLISRSYKPARAGVIDMFPQTYHIEGVVAFDLKN